jgi:hypothetical protein
LALHVNDLANAFLGDGVEAGSVMKSNVLGGKGGYGGERAKQ